MHRPLFRFGATSSSGFSQLDPTKTKLGQAVLGLALAVLIIAIAGVAQ